MPATSFLIRNGTLSINYGTTSSDVIERPFNFLDIESASLLRIVTTTTSISDS